MGHENKKTRNPTRVIFVIDRLRPISSTTRPFSITRNPQSPDFSFFRAFVADLDASSDLLNDLLPVEAPVLDEDRAGVDARDGAARDKEPADVRFERVR